MSPLIHAEVGWLLALPLAKRRDRILVAAAAVIPDVDGFGLLVSDALYENWHHKLAHGAIAAVVVTALSFAVMQNAKAALLALAAFHSHIVMDLAGSGPGWPILYFWPCSDVEWLPSWQWNLASWQNSVFGLTATLACLACAIPYARTPVEMFSPRADAKIVETLRNRFRRARGGASSS